MALTRWKPLVCGLAVSASVAVPAQAQDWGCQVLLCLANPGGPTQYAECVPPISRLWDALRRGNAFPSCNGASASTSGAANFSVGPSTTTTSQLASGTPPSDSFLTA